MHSHPTPWRLRQCVSKVRFRLTPPTDPLWGGVIFFSNSITCNWFERYYLNQRNFRKFIDQKINLEEHRKTFYRELIFLEKFSKHFLCKNWHFSNKTLTFYGDLKSVLLTQNVLRRGTFCAKVWVDLLLASKACMRKHEHIYACSSKLIVLKKELISTTLDNLSSRNKSIVCRFFWTLF